MDTAATRLVHTLERRISFSSLHCAHPSIVYSTQLQVRFRESVDLTFGVRPL